MANEEGSAPRKIGSLGREIAGDRHANQAPTRRANGNADALSHLPRATPLTEEESIPVRESFTVPSIDDLRRAQEQDPEIRVTID